MDVVKIILNIILCLDCLGLVVLVLMQEGKSAGLTGAIAGGADTFFGKKKAQSYEGLMVLCTKISAAVFIVLAIVLAVLAKFF